LGFKRHYRSNCEGWPGYYDEIVPKNPAPGGENRSHPATATCPQAAKLIK
jgi:hypothetical protein